TWLYPELQKRAQQGLITGPVTLTMALVLYEDAVNYRVQMNDEVKTSVSQLDIICAEPIVPGQAVSHPALGGLKRVRLLPELRNSPFVFIALGKEGKYYVLSHKMSRIVGNREFEVLANNLATEGVVIRSGDSLGQVYLDVVRNGYDGMPVAVKRRLVKNLSEA